MLSTVLGIRNIKIKNTQSLQSKIVKCDSDINFPCSGTIMITKSPKQNIMEIYTTSISKSCSLADFTEQN